jgi:hypothetical protein
MTDLLSSLASRVRPPVQDRPDDRPHRPRPLGVGAVLAGLAAPLSSLAVCAVVALAGWYDADGGGHGTTREALRVAADAWLLAHGAGLDLGTHTVTAVPLGLTALCAWLALRFGRHAAATCDVPDTRTLGFGVVVLAAVYAVVAVVTALLATAPGAAAHPGLAFLGGALVGGMGGGLGVATGAGLLPVWRERVSDSVCSAALAAVATVLLTTAAGSVLVAGSLVARFGDAATVFTRLDPGLLGGLVWLAVVAAIAPNAVLLGCAYLLGSGFAVGTGTLVAPGGVMLGPVPAVPLLAALPDPGPSPSWTLGLVGVPVVLGAAAGALAARAFPAPGLGVAAARGAAGGLLGAALLTALVVAAGGAVGPGRMADVGADLLPTLTAAVATTGPGVLVGGLAATLWQRRSARRAGVDVPETRTG